MKTAMQELIELLKELQLDAKNSGATEFQIAMTFAIGRAETKIEIEKEQIINAHLNGQSDHHFSLESRMAEAEQHYKEKYNQNK